MTFETVTELPGSKVSKIQLRRITNRYGFARDYCKGKDVLEIACGPGLGLGLLKKVAKSVVAVDIEWDFLKLANTWYKGTMTLAVTDAEELPFHNSSFDVMLLFEAIYYLNNPFKFAQEVRRVLRPGGCVIVSNPNKHIPGFIPSRWSHNYLDEFDIRELFDENQFSFLAFGDDPFLINVGVEKFTAIIREFFSKLDISPRSMKSKAIFRRLFSGKLVTMSHELSALLTQDHPVVPLQMNLINRTHKITFFVATLNANQTFQSSQDSNGLDGASNTSIRMMMEDDIDQIVPLYRRLISEDILSEFNQQLLMNFLRYLLPFSDSFVVTNNNQIVGFVFSLPADIIKFRKLLYVFKNFHQFLSLNLFSKTVLFKLLKKSTHIFSQNKPTQHDLKKCLRLLAIGIRDDYQGRGLGTDLLKKLETKPRDCDIVVSTYKTNVGAIRFYQKAGFSLVGFDNDKKHFFKPINVNHS